MYFIKFQVRYTGYRDRPQEDRIIRFETACREGHTEIAFAATGTNLQLVFAPPTTGYMLDRECDFDKEPGKVSVFRCLLNCCLHVKIYRSWLLHPEKDSGLCN